MLEKSLKKIKFCDAHFHLLDFKSVPSNWTGCTCAHSQNEWNTQKDFFNLKDNGFLSYGMHPQSAGKIDIKKESEFLEKLLINENQFINAIGETGFDYFTKEFVSHKIEMEQMWNIQLEFAIKYKKPLIVHCRKANQKLFEYANQLKKVPTVLFHSFMGSPVEANTLIKKGINCFFSFGKQMNNNNKNVILCVKKIPVENLLLETDAPFQFLKGQTKTELEEIKTIYESAYQLKNENDKSLADDEKYYDFCSTLEKNFYRMFLK